MGTTPMDDWLRTAEPPLPKVFLDRLRSEGPSEADSRSLVRLGTRALRRSMEAKGPHRSAAFDLLAADAFVTYACELAARAQDVEAELLGVLRSVGASLP